MGYGPVRMDARCGSRPDTSGSASAILRSERGSTTRSRSVSVPATSFRREAFRRGSGPASRAATVACSGPVCSLRRTCGSWAELPWPQFLRRTQLEGHAWRTARKSLVRALPPAPHAVTSWVTTILLLGAVVVAAVEFAFILARIPRLAVAVALVAAIMSALQVQVSSSLGGVDLTPQDFVCVSLALALAIRLALHLGRRPDTALMLVLANRPAQPGPWRHPVRPSRGRQRVS